MATIVGVHRKVAKGVHEVKWLTLLNGDAGDSYGIDEGAPFNPDKTFHIFGTFGAGGTIVIQGSNDGVNWLTLTDIHSNVASYTADAIDTIAENPMFIRPSVTAGDGTTDIDVWVSAHGVRPVR